MKRSLSVSVSMMLWATAGSLVVGAGTARAAETAAEILKLTDDAQNNFQDLTLESTMLIREPGQQNAREINFVTISKGKDKRLVRFTGPGDFKGMGFLVENRDTMYVLLPAFGNRVRRLGTHVKAQGFQGSDASYDDMATTQYTGIYAPKLVATEADAWVLELNILPGKQAESPRLKVWVDKNTHHQVTRIEYYDDKGQKQRTQLRTNFKKDEGNGEHYTPEWIKFIDHRRNDHTTELHTTKAQVNTGVSDDVFTQRSLQRGS
jgi:outer membrane lipoprotein-sorting protein